MSFFTVLLYGLLIILFILFILKLYPTFLYLYRKNEIVKSNPNLLTLPQEPFNYGIGQLDKFSDAFITFDWMKSLLKYNSPLVEVYVFFRPALITTDAEVVKTMTITKKFTKTDLVFKIFEELVGKGLASIDGDQWKFHRNLIMPVFIPQNIQKMYSQMVKHVKTYLDDWKIGKEFDNFISISSEISLILICSCGFGHDLEGLSELGHLFESLVDHYLPVIVGLSTVGTYYPLLPIPSTQKFHAIKRKIEGIINQIIEKRRNETVKRDSTELLTIMIQANDDEGKKFTNQELIDESLTFLFAGHDTTSTLVAFALYLLAKNPETQLKVQKELDEVFDQEPSYDDIAKLKYLDNVIKETLRMYPPAGFITRKSSENTVIKDFPIPKDSGIQINIIGLHYNPKYWKNPEEFNPDRFNEPYDKFAYIPFSVGPRDCAGRNFASITAPLILSLILKKYKVELNMKEELKINMTFVTKPHNLKLKFTQRN